MAEDVNPNPPHIDVAWDGAGTMHLIVEGSITSDHLVMAAFMLTRTASQMVDDAMRRARDLDKPSPLVAVRAPLRNEARA